MTTFGPLLLSAGGVVTIVPTSVITYSEKAWSNAPNLADFFSASQV